MIGEQPMAALAPLDYRYAFDAAMPALSGCAAPLVLCNRLDLLNEARQRLPRWAERTHASAGLWVEPLANTWRDDLQALSAALPAGSALAVIASRPLARLLPERRFHARGVLGARLGGIGRLRHGMNAAGFAVLSIYGMHSALVIGLNQLSRALERAGQPALADRLHFAARLRYCATGILASCSTVALLIAEKRRS